MVLFLHHIYIYIYIVFILINFINPHEETAVDRQLYFRCSGFSVLFMHTCQTRGPNH